MDAAELLKNKACQYVDYMGRPEAWMEQFYALFLPIGKGAIYHKGSHFDVVGPLTLQPKIDGARALQLMIDGNLSLEVWSGDEGVTFKAGRDGVLQAYATSREASAKLAADLPANADRRFYRERVQRRIDKQINFAWGGEPLREMSADDFAIRWTGRIDIPKAGRYRFFTTSDDGVRLYIDGKRIIDNWTDHAPAVDTAEVSLRAGQVDVVIEYYEGVGGSEIRLEWEGPDIKRQVVPATSLFVSDTPGLRTACSGVTHGAVM